jgi:hypothetical protein
MYREVAPLIELLDEAIALFRKHNCDNWVAWLEKDAALHRASDPRGIAHLLSAYGGMGSLNDIGFGEDDPENPGWLRTHPDDKRLQEVLNEIHSLAYEFSKSSWPIRVKRNDPT